MEKARVRSIRREKLLIATVEGETIVSRMYRLEAGVVGVSH